MKHRTLYIWTGLFFLIINTLYFWDGYLGVWSMVLTIGLLFYFLILAVVLLYQLVLLCIERFKSRSRIIVTGVLALVIGLTALRPRGIIPYNLLEGDDLFVAFREGSANCTSTLKLKEDHCFTHHSICFGVAEAKGAYAIKGDTVFFLNMFEHSREHQQYAFGVYSAPSPESSGHGGILLYKKIGDEMPLLLYVQQNNLFK
jgi:hypothetical protein